MDGLLREYSCGGGGERGAVVVGLLGSGALVRS